MDGLLLLDKPAGRTSHDVVDEVRKAAGQREVGHAGTLDPAATGLLVILLGRALRVAEFLEGHDKEYEATFRFGVTTDTDDADGKVLSERPASLSREALEAAAATFVGEIEQRPPVYSAVRVGGERLHKKARRGEKVEPPLRKVRIDELRLLGLEGADARFLIRCGKGTYVRSIARDLGEALGCGAHVAKLRRTASGPFRVEDAAPLVAPLDPLPMDAGLMSMSEARLSTGDARRFEQGQAVDLRLPGPLARVYCGPRFLGIGECSEGKLKPRKVIVTPTGPEGSPWPSA